MPTDFLHLVWELGIAFPEREAGKLVQDFYSTKMVMIINWFQSRANHTFFWVWSFLPSLTETGIFPHHKEIKKNV